MLICGASSLVQKNTKCMVTGKNATCFNSAPTWYMGTSTLKTLSNLDILGVNFSS